MKILKSKTKRGEGSLHPLPEGRGIRDPPRSLCNKVRGIFRRGIKAFEFSGTLMLNYMQNSLLLRNEPANSSIILKNRYKSLYMMIFYPR